MILVFDANGYRANLRVNDDANIDAEMASMYERLPNVGGMRSISMAREDGEEILVLDRQREGVSWLARMLSHVVSDSAASRREVTAARLQADGDELIEMPPMWAVIPIWKRQSRRFYLALWWVAVVLGANGRFAEVRRMVYAMRQAALFGRSKELNRDYLGDAKGLRRIRRAIAFSSILLVAERGRQYALVIGLCLVYSAWSMTRV